jgi:SdrD B-like domain
MSNLPLGRRARRQRLAMRGAAGMLSVFSAVSGFPFAAAIPSASAAPGDVEGSVWQDTKPNGVRDTAAPTEAGIQGVTVTLYASDDTAAGTATTAANGTYAVTPTKPGPWRLEFSTLPKDYVAGRETVADNGSSVRFVSAAGANNDLAVSLLGEYCQANPDYISNCFTIGRADQASATRSALFQIPGDARGYEGGPFWTPFANKATANQIGATYGLGYQNTSNSAFAAAFVRRFVGFGPAGISAIYKNNAPFVKLVDYGIDVGTDTHVLSAPNKIDNHDAPTFAAVGKTGLGDLDVSVDGKRIYTVNMFKKQLVSIPLTRAGALNVAATGNVSATNAVPAEQQIGQFDIPAAAGCAPASWRPMGIGMRGTSVFVGGVCSDRQITIHSLDPATGAWSENVASFDVSFNREGGETFKVWNDVEIAVQNAQQYANPQPMLADIAFDGQDLVLGVRDRWGDQTGFGMLTTNTADTTKRYSGQTAGDTLRACWNGASWTLEANASCGTRTNAPGVANNDGPGGGEYYHEDDLIVYDYNAAGVATRGQRLSWHRNMSEGGLATASSGGTVATTFMDPQDCNSQGLAWFDNGTGNRVQSWHFDQTTNCIHQPTLSAEGFGKTNGMGDIEALCDEAPFEIGNRVWADLDKDGRQDANEPALAGVTVELYNTDGATKIGEAITDANGNYVFSNAVGTDRGDAKYGITALKPLTDGYVIKVPAGQTVLDKMTTTNATTAPAAGDATATDSDSNGVVVAVNGATAIVNTGIAGTNDHTIDFGFSPSYSLGNRVWIDNDNSGAFNGSEVGVDGVKVTLYRADATGKATGAILATETTTGGGFYRFDDLGAGDYVVVVDAMNFTAGMPLAGYISSTGASQEADANLNVDNNDNGLDAVIAAGEVGAGGIASSKVTLGGLTDEPTAETPVQGARAETTIDARSNLTVDFGFNKRYELGNRVFFDANNNGLQDTDETGVSNVKVSLYKADAAGKPVCAPVATATTDADGRYLFTNLLPGDYIVGVDGTNFAVGAPLDERFSSTGAGQNANPNSDIDSDDNGIDTPVTDACAKDSIVSGVVTLSGDEKTGETDKAIPASAAPDTQSNLTVDFGFYSKTAVFQLGNRVFMDADNSGNMNGAEMPIANAKVSLYKADAAGNPTGVAVATDVTDAAGFYRFDNLDAGDYVVVVDRANFAKDGVLFGKGTSTGAAQKADPNTDIDRDDNGLDTPLAAGSVNPGGIRSGKVTLGPSNTEPTGETELDATPLGNRDFRSNLTVDFGFQTLPTHSLGNTVWVDENNNGKIDPSEKGLAGVCVKAYGAGLDGIIGNADDEVLGETTTDENGLYLFTKLVAGDYIVEICTPDGYVSSTEKNGSATGPFEGDATPSPESTPTDSDDNGTQVPGTTVIRSKPVTLGNGEPTAEPQGTGLTDPNPDNRSDVTVDFGLFKPAALGNYVWLDNNRDGKQDAGEPGVPGVKVQLIDVAGAVVAETTTDNTGKYLFDYLTSMGYKVQFVKSTFPAGASLTSLDKGDDASDSDAMPSGMTDVYLLLPGERNLTVDAGLVGEVVLTAAPPAPTTAVPTTVAPTTAPAVVAPAPTAAPTTVAAKPTNALVVKVFEDTNKDGKSAAGEPGINTAIVELVDPSGKVTRVPVNPDGTIRLEGIPAGEYTIRVVSIGVDGKATTKVLGKVVVPATGEAQIEFGYAVEPQISADLAFTGFATWRLMFLAVGMILVGSTFVRRTRKD